MGATELEEKVIESYGLWSLMYKVCRMGQIPELLDEQVPTAEMFVHLFMQLQQDICWRRSDWPRRVELRRIYVRFTLIPTALVRRNKVEILYCGGPLFRRQNYLLTTGG